MSLQSNISWTETTWNPLAGCEKTSPGCAHCYAVPNAHRLAHNPNPKVAQAYAGLTTVHANGQLDWTGELRLLPDRLEQPLHWRQPRMIFVNSMSDLLHEDVPDAWIDEVMAVIVGTTHTYQVLTKRAERMVRYFAGDPWPRVRVILRERYDWRFAAGRLWMPENLWLGVSCENQAMASQRLPWLQQTGAAVRFLSLEPLLGPIPQLDLDGIHWVIVGGESGPDFRCMQLGWLEQIVATCDAAGVPVWVKQACGSRPGQQGTIPDHLWRQERPALAQERR